MRIAVIGQSVFGAEVFRLLRQNGHEIVGVFTIPDVNGKPDPLGNIHRLTFHYAFYSLLIMHLKITFL